MDDENAQKIEVALSEFGFDSLSLVKESFLKPDTIIQIGYPPNRIDIMTSSDGISFEEAYKFRQEVSIDEITLPFVGLEALIKTKETTGRLQDLADAENLKKINNA